MIDWLFSKERAIEHAYERAEELMHWDDADCVVILERPDGTEEERHTVVAEDTRTLRAG